MRKVHSPRPNYIIRKSLKMINFMSVILSYFIAFLMFFVYFSEGSHNISYEFANFENVLLKFAIMLS